VGVDEIQAQREYLGNGVERVGAGHGNTVSPVFPVFVDTPTTLSAGIVVKEVWNNRDRVER